MSKLIALARIATYVAQTPLEHNGKPVAIGAPIDLGPEAAQPLLDVGAITHSDGDAPQALQVQHGGTDGVAALMQALESRDQLLADAQRDIVALQATVAELHQAAAEQGAAHAAELDGLREQRAALTAQRDEAALASANLQAGLAQTQAQLDKAKADLAKASAKTK